MEQKVLAGSRSALALLAALAAASAVGLVSSGLAASRSEAPLLVAQADPAAPPVSRYCPELRLRDGTETLRRYANGKEGDNSQVVWQASIVETARECRSDGASLTMRVGVAGRVLAGRAGGAGAQVSAPVRIVVLRFEGPVLASELRPLSVALGASGSAAFREVYEVTVPAPGEDRDYLVYVGFDGAEPAKPKVEEDEES